MRSIVWLLCALSMDVAWGTQVHYDLVSLGSGRFQYAYLVTNDTLTQSIDEFTIYFSRDETANLTVGGAPAGWDVLTVQPDSNLPDDGFYDALALTAGIAPTASAGNFSVSFDFLDSGLPASQRFEIVDRGNLSVLDAGTTIARTVVPLPPAWGLLAVAVSGLCVRRRCVRRGATCRVPQQVDADPISVASHP